MNILITGGAGYIGSVLTDILLKNNYKVTIIDNFMYNQSSLNHLCVDKKLKIVNSDVRNLNAIKNYYFKSDIIIPLAAIVGAPACDKDPINSKLTNKDSILDLFKILSKDQMIIMPTTNSAYGSGDKNNLCDENSPLNPISSYAKDKVQIEHELMQKENVISLRLATVFGMSPRMRVDLLVNDFVFRAVFDKFIVLYESHFKRNYIHISDVSNAFLHSINNFDSMKSEIYNVGLSDANLSKKELCDIIKLHIKDLNIITNNFTKDPDQRNYIVSNKKIENTGFRPKVSINEGIEELIKGYTFAKKNTFGNI